MRRIRRVVLGAASSGAAGSEGAQAAPLSNDGFAEATAIASLPFTTSEDTTQATLDSADTAVGATCSIPPEFTFSNGVWFSYTPSSTQQVQINTSGSSYGIAGGVVTGDPLAATLLPDADRRESSRASGADGYRA